MTYSGQGVASIGKGGAEILEEECDDLVVVVVVVVVAMLVKVTQ